MAIILDADVIIRGERGLLRLNEWLMSLPNERFHVAAITVAELWHGVGRATRQYRLAREQYLQAVVESVEVLPYTEQTAYQHARIWAELESAGKMIGAYDLIVAATALENSTPLATYNKRHFVGITGLDLIEPE
jgi:predicted nucleic acid-binding protein